MKDKNSAKYVLDTRGIKKDLALVVVFAAVTFTIITVFRLTNTNAQTFTKILEKLGQLL